jgi:hypothetical protein
MFTKNTLGDFPWIQLLYDNSDNAALSETYALPTKGAWLLPQVTAYIASLPLKRNAEGLFDVRLSIEPLIASEFPNFQDGRPCSTEAFMGILKYILLHPRGLIMPIKVTQVSEAGSRWNASVPLFLAAFKEMRGIPYSAWSTDNLEKVVDKDLMEVLLVNEMPEFSLEELLKYRDIARTVATRTTEYHTEYRKVSATTATRKTGDSNFDSLPKLVRLMLIQTWIFSVPNAFGIRQPINIDDVPENLVSTNVLPKDKVYNNTSFWNTPVKVDHARLAIEEAKRMRKQG